MNTKFSDTSIEQVFLGCDESNVVLVNTLNQKAKTSLYLPHIVNSGIDFSKKGYTITIPEKTSVYLIAAAGNKINGFVRIKIKNGAIVSFKDAENWHVDEQFHVVNTPIKKSEPDDKKAIAPEKKGKK